MKPVLEMSLKHKNRHHLQIPDELMSRVDAVSDNRSSYAREAITHYLDKKTTELILVKGIHARLDKIERTVNTLLTIKDADSE